MGTKKYILVGLGLGIWACTPSAKFSEGEELYKEHCANCHIEDGTGVGELVPPLAGSDYLAKSGVGVACIIRQGLRGKIVVNGISFEAEMPANAKLSEVEIANIVNYIGNAWGNKTEFVSLEKIKTELKKCQ